MIKYPRISAAILHTPRPTTDVLESIHVEINMSISPSLRPQTELEPPPNGVPVSNASGDGYPYYPQFLLFGDSITQFGTLTLQAYLQTQYIRRLDVVNRGLSGFTAPMGFRALQKVLPSTTPEVLWPRIKVVTIFFGANDACLPGQSQHVQLQKYVDTLEGMIQYPVFCQNGVNKTEVIVITPPPVNEHQFQKLPDGSFQRRAGITSQYARAAREAGKAVGAHVFDFWSILMRKVGWEASMGVECCCKHIPCHFDLQTTISDSLIQHIPGCSYVPASSPKSDYQLGDFLTDGLHLTKLGYDVFFWELLKLIKQEIPHCAPENLPFILPEWRTALEMSDYCQQR